MHTPSFYAPHPLAGTHVRARQSSRRVWRTKASADDMATAAALIASRR